MLTAAQLETQGLNGRLKPSLQLTGHQLFYVFGLDGIGDMALSGGVNFALAYGMYTTQDTVKNPIRLFQLPNTLSGDAAVTIIVQCILTWFVEMGLVSYDLSKRSVQPIGFIQELSSSDPGDSEVEEKEPQPESKVPPVLTTIVQGALRGFILAAFKAILGGVLGLLTTPLMALFWLIKAGWEGNDERMNAWTSRQSRYMAEV
ncbi:uncharacterized protein BKA55DRAFT_668961 [Fusarium redolens]|uniref:Uncharacterized protein n=1 Tax=Fusarium redolens TaxID=48865 RepID=A0A9P9FUA1_FUSRE|nr:uncharacterized protein BKA55DRAFT_668961 [Fusarium redolens]KAH7203074.1 hypothetical protein BKA55DRAFT_668961 [Fusarium redolens]